MIGNFGNFGNFVGKRAKKGPSMTQVIGYDGRNRNGGQLVDIMLGNDPGARGIGVYGNEMTERQIGILQGGAKAIADANKRHAKPSPLLSTTSKWIKSKAQKAGKEAIVAEAEVTRLAPGTDVYHIAMKEVREKAEAKVIKEVADMNQQSQDP